MRYSSYILFILCYFASCETPIEKESAKLKDLDILKRAARPGDWLEDHKESYLTLTDYIRRKPLRTDSVRKYLYVVKLGNFDSVSNRIFSITKEYLATFFLIKVKELYALDVQIIPKENTRANGQIDAAYILDTILYKIVPNDAHSIIALTTIDMYPGNDWNFIFGLASYQKRVGVWSMSRFYEYESDTLNFDKTLFRTLNTASHETGHMFGLPHCAVYECSMNGSNSLTESDRQVGWLCHECLAKLCWNRNIPAKNHIDSMKIFYSKYLRNSREAAYYKSASEIMN